MRDYALKLKCAGHDDRIDFLLYRQQIPQLLQQMVAKSVIEPKNELTARSLGERE